MIGISFHLGDLINKGCFGFDNVIIILLFVSILYLEQTGWLEQISSGLHKQLDDDWNMSREVDFANQSNLHLLQYFFPSIYFLFIYHANLAVSGTTCYLSNNTYLSWSVSNPNSDGNCKQACPGDNSEECANFWQRAWVYTFNEICEQEHFLSPSLFRVNFRHGR